MRRTLILKKQMSYIMSKLNKVNSASSGLFFLMIFSLVSLVISPQTLAQTTPSKLNGTKVPEFADPDKVLRTIFPVAETGFDPAGSRDLYSHAIVEVVFERLYGYDYLASPAKIIPQTADGLPEISPDGKTYTIKLKRGIYFTPDEAFKGKKRELTMNDYVYSIKRLLDPRIASSHSWLFEGKIVGLDDLTAKAKKPENLITKPKSKASKFWTNTPYVYI